MRCLADRLSTPLPHLLQRTIARQISHIHSAYSPSHFFLFKAITRWDSFGGVKPLKKEKSTPEELHSDRGPHSFSFHILFSVELEDSQGLGEAFFSVNGSCGARILQLGRHGDLHKRI